MVPGLPADPYLSGKRPVKALAARYNRRGHHPARIVAGSEPAVSGGFGSPSHQRTMANGAM